MSTKKSRIIYIERKAESLNGPARIGRVTFSKTGRTVEYRGQKFSKSKSGYKWNHFDIETGDHYWIRVRGKTAKTGCIPKAPNPSKLMRMFGKSTGRKFAGWMPAVRAKRRINPLTIHRVGANS